MSAQGPSNPLGNRPRMAEALASLKEGLRDTADPLYDGWKLRPRAPGLAHPSTPPAEDAPPPADAANRADTVDPLAEAGETIEITFDGPIDGAPISETEPETPRLADDREPEKLRADEEEWLGDGLPRQVGLIEALNEEGAPTIGRRPSVQTDTVRVRVVRYQHFPRWALIAAAAFLVFAFSVLVLRASFPRQSARSGRAVLASETTTAVTDRARFAAPSAVVAPPPPSVATPARSGARLSPAPIGEPPPPLPAELGTKSTPRASSSPPAALSAPSPAAKIPTPSPRRRPAGHDFFRDPGF